MTREDMLSFKISQRQLDAIYVSDDQFATWYVEDVFKNFFCHLYHVLSPEGCLEMVINGRHCAMSYGFRTTEAQAHFVGLMWDIGPNFHLFPGFRDILLEDKSTEMEKIDLLYSDRVSKEEVKAAIDGADDSYWYR